MLELPQLLERISSLCLSPLGAARVRALAPCNDLPTVARRQRRLSELRALIEEKGQPGLDGFADVRPLLSRLAVDGAYLLPEELAVMADFLGAAGRAADFLEDSEGRFPEVFRLANRITPLPGAASRLRSIIGPGNSVASQASPALARLRRDLAKARDRLRQDLEGLVGREDMAGVFSDSIVTQRADRFVVPVKTDAKGRVQGIIHDTSGSGATCFVEPLQAIEGNNQLALLRRQEREEEERVLIQASRELAVNLQVLREDLAALAQLDCLLAQAEFCERINASEPRLNRQGELELNQARHPLLAWRAATGRGRAVPIQVAMGAERRVLIISGANAGGKTATLKTVGLITLLAMCGVHVPCQGGSRVAVFDRLLAEVGDEQDLMGELSTFTAHAGRLAWMVRTAGANSLALIDELGGGTDPGEGAALGIAVLDWLKRQGAAVLCTTHFHRLKAYGAVTEGVANVSVAFDPGSGKPTYQLHYGLPGFSGALSVSRSLGFPPELLTQAEAAVDQGERQTLELMRQVQEAYQNAQAELASAGNERRLAAQERQEARAMLKSARAERAGALSEGKRRVREVARRMEERLNELYGQTQAAKERASSPAQAPKLGQVRQELFAARRQALEQVEQAVAPAADSPLAKPASDLYALKAGDPVHLLSLGQRGSLLEDLRPGLEQVAVSVGVSGVRVLVPLREMEPLPENGAPARKPSPGVLVQASAGDGLDLNLVGLTVDEALPLVDKALDQALVAGRNDLTVVHGKGSGRLRAAVREYLEKHPFVVAIHQPEGRRGGAGVTVAELRD